MTAAIVEISEKFINLSTTITLEVKKMAMKALTFKTDSGGDTSKSFCATLPSPPDPGKAFCATLPSDP